MGSIIKRIACGVAAVMVALSAASAIASGADVTGMVASFAASNTPSRLECAIVLPEGAPQSKALLSVTDRDGLWFQQLSEGMLRPGTNLVSFALLGEDAGRWEAYGHGGSWNRRTLVSPKAVEIRVFASHGDGGEVGFDLASLEIVERAHEPPVPYDIRPGSSEVRTFDLFEVRFRLPDAYANPFDPDEIAVDAIVAEEWDGGGTVSIPCFYTQDFKVLTNDLSDVTLPCGRPEWALRHSPLNPGRHSCRIVARDATGVCTSSPVFFDALPGDPARGYVRVRGSDPRRLEVGGRVMFPVGHNIRSPFDTRMDDQFPWRLRRRESFLVYSRYFADMAAAGEDLAEVWMCQWSLGLEWAEGTPRYHGVGDYNLDNAWQLDQVLGMARANGVRVNLVLNNHGRAGLGYDAEWQGSPYNVANGGRLPEDEPLKFFSDEWAMKMQEHILRYTVARWGWDPTIFAWELWSELDLCGKMNANAHKDPRVVKWHKRMAGYLKGIDLRRHLVSTHISSDYRAVGKELTSLDELDLCCVDAYHFNPSPMHIFRLLAHTARDLAVYRKPVLVTEFGGSSMGGGLSHLRCELHAALWASSCTTLAATPLFWWWGLVEEEGLYPEYTAIRAFTDEVPYDDPALNMTQLVIDGPEGAAKLNSLSMSSGTNLCAWVCSDDLFIKYIAGENGASTNAGRNAVWTPVTNGTYRVSFCSTETGRPVLQRDFRASDGSLRFPIPPFVGDIGIRAKLLP